MTYFQIHYKNTSRDCLLGGIQVHKYKRVSIKTVSAGSNSKLERYAIDLLTSLKIQHKYTSRQEDTQVYKYIHKGANQNCINWL